MHFVGAHGSSTLSSAVQLLNAPGRPPPDSHAHSATPSLRPRHPGARSTGYRLRDRAPHRTLGAPLTRTRVRATRNTSLPSPRVLFPAAAELDQFGRRYHRSDLHLDAQAGKGERLHANKGVGGAAERLAQLDDRRHICLLIVVHLQGQEAEGGGVTRAAGAWPTGAETAKNSHVYTIEN